MKSLLLYWIALFSHVLTSITAWVALPWFVPKPVRRGNTRAFSSASPWEILSSTNVVNPKSGSLGPAVSQKASKNKKLVVVMPQLGDFDSTEYTGLLAAALDELQRASIELKVIGVGDTGTAKRFCNFTGLPLECLFVDPTASVHQALGCHGGPDWDVPSFLPDGFYTWFAARVGAGDGLSDNEARDVTRAWMKYMAMCAGIAAPGTLQEILRGYLGDKSAPELLRPNETVTAGPIAITGVTDVKIGPIEYQSLWKNESGYQRPAELATVRLRAMVELLSNLKEYVPDQRFIHWRGATFLFESDNTLIYQYMNQGVLTYSETMSRPLSFLTPYVDNPQAVLNPFGLGDPALKE